MNLAAKIAISAAALLVTAGGAMAADLMAPPPPEAAITSDWEGGYVGLMGTYWSPAPTYGEVDGVAGFNFLPAESFLIGVEGSLGYYSEIGGAGYTGFDASFSARAGFVAGPVLIYANVGEWYDISAPGPLDPFVGVGVEVAMTDSVSLRGQVEYFPQDATTNTVISGGLIFHFH